MRGNCQFLNPVTSKNKMVYDKIINIHVLPQNDQMNKLEFSHINYSGIKPIQYENDNKSIGCGSKLIHPGIDM